MEAWLPYFFVGVMGLALLLYVILDGYDLGVGLLLPFAPIEEHDRMVASIGPFWDANETWLVLGVGVLLVVFPQAHGIILTSLYLPATLMLIGLVLRGIAFDFRVKAGDKHKRTWNALFSLGSLVAALCQGWMLGAYITGLDDSLLSRGFALLIALSLPALYVLLGALWLMGKTRGELPVKALSWARLAWLPMGFALLLISIATPLVSERIAEAWFSFPHALMLLPIPLLTLYCYGWIGAALHGRVQAKPLRIFFMVAAICLLSAIGLAYSIWPDIIIGRMRILEAVAGPKSLLFTFVGVVLTLPMILGYTVFIYRIFRGVEVKQAYE
jgi:cytochrome d ubiquinol oxidase subunit II